jgi:hypothetical protein
MWFRITSEIPIARTPSNSGIKPLKTEADLAFEGAVVVGD